MSNPKLLMGIDPGKQGFLTLLSKNGFEFYPMPTQKVETGKFNKNGTPVMETVFWPEGFKNLIEKIAEQYEGYEKFCAIELVNGRFGWSAENNFSFGHTAGMQAMIPIMLGAKTYFVRPQKWQSFMYQGFEKVMIKKGKKTVHDTKATSKLVAETLAPDIDFRKTARSKNVDDNKTDSFLLCMYLKNFLKIDL